MTVATDTATSAATSASADLPDLALLTELEPAAATGLDRHLAVAKEWFPHEYVPWGRGRDYDGPAGEAWERGHSSLSPVAQVAFEVNLLTEDNLPSYHREITRAFGRDGAWGTWAHRWTAEESRHALVMRDWLLVSRGVDPVALERARMAVLEHGFETGPVGAEKDALHVLAYVAVQELATRVSHRNTGRVCADESADRLLSRVAMDENLHMVFYRGLVDAALDLAPSQAMRAVADEVLGFGMPGAMIADFGRKARQIANAGIYDLRIHRDEVLLPLLRHWQFFERTGLDGAAEAAREQVSGYLEGLSALAARQEERRAAA